MNFSMRLHDEQLNHHSGNINNKQEQRKKKNGLQNEIQTNSDKLQ